MVLQRSLLEFFGWCPNAFAGRFSFNIPLACLYGSDMVLIAVRFLGFLRGPGWRHDHPQPVLSLLVEGATFCMLLTVHWQTSVGLSAIRYAHCCSFKLLFQLYHILMCTHPFLLLAKFNHHPYPLKRVSVVILHTWAPRRGRWRGASAAGRPW